MSNETTTSQKNLNELSEQELIASRSQVLYEFGEVEYHRLKMLKDLETVEKRAQSLLNTVQQIDSRLTELKNTEIEMADGQ